MTCWFMPRTVRDWKFAQKSLSANAGIDRLDCHSYLNNRTRRVKVDYAISRSFSAPSDIPHGGCAPLLLYMLFLVLKIRCCILNNVKYLEYVDDISLWRTENGMLLSLTKCNVLEFKQTKLDYHKDGVLLSY